MQKRWTRSASTISVAGTVLAMVGLLMAAAPVAGGSSATCVYTGSSHKVRLSISGSGDTRLARGADGRIYVNGIWCDGAATRTNTDHITVLAGAGDQSLTLYLGSGGFQPGFTPEVGDSPEIEISVSLGGGSADTVRVWGSSAADHVIVGKSSGFATLGAMNLNSNETSGIDADLTLIVGIEYVQLYGLNGADHMSAAGGGGTGVGADFSVQIVGGDGPDVLTGGTVNDEIIGQAGADVLKGGPGPDYLDATDGVNGNDAVYGGGGSDTCLTDPGDSKTSC